MKQVLKQKATWLWKNGEKLLIVVFLASFTLNIRKVFLNPYSFLNGGLNEYMIFSLSWADTLIMAVIIIYTIKYIISQLNKVSNSNTAQYNNNKLLSTIPTPRLVSRETILLIMFLAWAGLSIIWSAYKPIATYRLATLLEITIFVAIAAKSLKNKKWLGLALFALIANGLFQSILGTAQFIHNEAVGLHILGESFLGPNIAGVAKIITSGEKHIRAYGTLPHPNILAGFLIIPLFLILGEILKKIFPNSAFSRINPEDECLAKRNETNQYSRARSVLWRFASHETLMKIIPSWLLWLFLIILGTGFLLTFSRSAFLAVLAGLMFIIWKLRMEFAKFIRKNNRSVGIFWLSVALVFVLVLSFMFAKDTSLFSGQSLEERNLYNNVSYETLLEHPVTGTGLGQFVLNEYKRYPKLESWQYQPVHNIYLLILNELGIAGLILILLFMMVFLQRRRGDEKSELNLTYEIIYGMIISFAIISFFDHYFWDIKMGIVILALLFLFFVRVRNRQENVSLK